ncbi:hypothetical protein [Treponema pedis]|uniref:hypothetical protein n=1 Tax=Treponema pedis TaxID=409322 RepID=UPI003D1CD593
MQYSDDNTIVPIDEICQWQKEGRKIITDEHGLNFYEGMTPFEKVQWIEHEIKNIKENIKGLKKEEKEILSKRDIDYEQEFYSGRYGLIKPDPEIKNLQKQCEKYIEGKKYKKEFIRKRKKEYENEIREYEEDIKYYK